MNDLNKILKDYEENNLELLDLGFTTKNDKSELSFVQLIEVRSPSWEIVYEITSNECRVLEFNYDNEQQEQSNVVLKTFEEAQSIASEWC